MITLAALQPTLETSWAADTCFNAKEWSTGNPARGQCVVTSLVVQHFLGGDLQKMTTVFRGTSESHYYNLLPDGTSVDLTRKQYPPNQTLAPSEVNLHGFANVREKMLHEPETKRHYDLLLERVTKKLTS